MRYFKVLFVQTSSRLCFLHNSISLIILARNYMKNKFAYNLNQDNVLIKGVFYRQEKNYFSFGFILFTYILKDRVKG